MTTQLGPLNESKRIASLDIMRGFALLGILIANSIHFQYGLFPTSHLHNLYPLGIVDQIAEMFILLFAQASFYPLFSFLFGYGMSLLKNKCDTLELPFASIYWRRMIILFLFGIIHSFFIWDGDILLTYALAGSILFFMLKLRDKGLLIWASCLLLLMASSVLVGDDDESAMMMDEELIEYSSAEMNAFTDGSYIETVIFRLHADPLNMGGLGIVIIQISAILSVLGMFLLGAFFARKRLFERLTTFKPLIKKIWLSTLILGFLTKLPYLFHDSYQNEILHTMIGGPLVAMFYATTIVLFVSRNKDSKLLKSLSFVGRLSLTNYVMQSVIFTTLFYSYGLGLFNKIGIFSSLLLSFIFFIFQVLVSKWWLSHFYFGPLEWLWRIGTYLQIPTFKRSYSNKEH